MITDIVKNQLCTGCGTCIPICPNSAIILKKDFNKGIYSPELINERCNNCGLCIKVCPGIEVLYADMNKQIFSEGEYNKYIGNYFHSYIGYSQKSQTRFNSSSGGLVTELLIFALKERIIDGVLVTKMNDEAPLDPQPFIATTPDQIIEAATSKYCPVPANIVIKYILENEGKYAVVGLPCHINGIRKAESINKKLKNRIILHIGIFCGRNLNFLGTEFLLKKLKIHSNDIKKIQYRGKGWPGNLIIEFKKQDNSIVIPYFKYYDNILASFVPWRCSLCNDKVCELADISCGDAWLPEYINDKTGISIAISRNKMGDELLKRMNSVGVVNLIETTIEKVIESQGNNEGFSWKKKEILARIKLLSVIGKKSPVYDNNLCIRPSFMLYIRSLFFYSQQFLSSKRYLWFVLVIYMKLIDTVSQIKTKTVG